VKKLVAYSSVSHLGFVMLGLFAMTTSGVSGAILQMLNHGISTGALFLLVGVIYDRRHTRELDEFGGLAKVMPLYATCFVIVAMSSVGLPGTNGFVGEFMILSGTFASQTLNPWPRIDTLLAATGVILAAIYMLHAVLRMFFGPLKKEPNKGLTDLNSRELAALAPLLVLVFWIGLAPGPFLSTMKASVETFLVFSDQKSRLSNVLTAPTILGIDPSGEVDDSGAGEEPPEVAAAVRIDVPAPGGQP
jgi:NADH-quinone oxidoreductase subunit M